MFPSEAEKRRRRQREAAQFSLSRIPEWVRPNRSRPRRLGLAYMAVGLVVLLASVRDFVSWFDQGGAAESDFKAKAVIGGVLGLIFLGGGLVRLLNDRSLQ